MAKNAEEAALEYRQALDDLKDNNKMQINLMTILADDYNSFSKEIINVIAEQIMKVVPSQKLAVMYVMDSILKNVTGAGNYKEHIEKIIYRLFVHVFEKGDERTRLALHKLRQTWTGIFQRSTLYKIDLSVNAIDPAWPVVTPQPVNASTSATNVTTNKPDAVVMTQQPRGAAKVHVNPHFLQKSTVTGSSATSTTVSTTTATPATGGDSKLHVSVERKKTGCDPRLAKHAAAAMGSTAKSIPLAVARTENVIVKQEPIDSSDVDERLHPQVGNILDGAEVRNYGRRKDQDFVGRSQGDVVKRKSPPCISDLETVDKRPRLCSPAQDRDCRTDSPSTSSIIRPTNDLGSHAFLATARRAPVTTATAVPSPAPMITPVTGPMILPAIPSTSGPLPFIPPIIPTVPLPVPISGMTTMLPAPRMMTVPGGGQDLPRPGGINHTPPVINNETPKLEGIPANNRIFVDGRAYEVSYINDVPVIERNGLPHRIYFTGVPRNVIIDGVAYQLAFGEEKRVIIDGEEHVLRFGAPSRELYMGTYPFKGAFGGPPIFATINGVRHEIRLGGPPPEVKIEPDPCYELLRYMPRTGTEGANKAPAAGRTGNESSSTVDVKGLLAKLQRTGILSALNANSRRNEGGGDSPNRPVTPPIPSEHRGEVTERLPKPPTDLKSFSVRALRIRYTSVVESLHQKRRLCPNCGLRFSELKGERYQQHLDWHFRENLRSNESSRCRGWYLPVDEWYEYSEQEELTATTSTARTLGTGADETAKDAAGGTNSIPSDSVTSKECGVCKERFEEYWEEDDDVWKLRDCVLGQDGKAFHPGCILDASAIRMPEDDSPSEEEHGDKLLFVDNMKLKKDFSVVDS